METPKITLNSLKPRIEKKHKHKKSNDKINAKEKSKNSLIEEKEETKQNLVNYQSFNELKNNKQHSNKKNSESKDLSHSQKKKSTTKKTKKNKKSKSTMIEEKSTNKIKLYTEKHHKKFLELKTKLKKIIFNLKYLQKIKKKYFQYWYSNTFIVEEEEEEEEEDEEEEEEESENSFKNSSEKKNRSDKLNNRYKMGNDYNKKKNINIKNTKNKNKNMRIEEYDDELEEIQEHEPDEEESVILTDNKKSKMRKNRIIITLRKIIKYKNKKYPYFKKWVQITKKISPLDNNSTAKKHIKNYIERGNNQKGIFMKYFNKWNNIIKNMKFDESKKKNINKNSISELKILIPKNQKTIPTIGKLGREIISLSDDESQTQSEVFDTEVENSNVKINKKIPLKNIYKNNNNIVSYKKNNVISPKFKQNLINNDKKIKRIYFTRWMNIIKKKDKEKENDSFNIDIIPLNKSLDNYSSFRKKDIKTNIIVKRYFMPENELNLSVQEKIRYDDNSFNKTSYSKPKKNKVERPIFQKRKISNNFPSSSNRIRQITSPFSNKKFFNKFSNINTPDRNLSVDNHKNVRNKIEDIKNRHKISKLKRYLIMNFPKITNKYNSLDNKNNINKVLQSKLLKIFRKAYCRQNKKSIYFDKWFNDTFNSTKYAFYINQPTSHRKTPSHLLYKNKRAKNNFKMNIKFSDTQRLSKKEKLFINIPKGYIRESPRFYGKSFEDLNISSFVLGVSNIVPENNSQKITNVDVLEGSFDDLNKNEKCNKLKYLINKITDKNKNKKSIENVFILKKHFSIWLNKMFLHDIDDFENSKAINKLGNMIKIINEKNEKKNLEFYSNKWKNIIKGISEMNINISSLKNIKYELQKKRNDKLQNIINNKIKKDNLNKLHNYFNRWKKLLNHDSKNNTKNKKYLKFTNFANNSFTNMRYNNENNISELDEEIDFPKLTSRDFQKKYNTITESFELEQKSKIKNTRNNTINDDIQYAINYFSSINNVKNKRVTDYNKYFINTLNITNNSNQQITNKQITIDFLQNVQISDKSKENKYNNVLIPLLQKLDKKFNIIKEKKYFNIWKKKRTKGESIILNEEDLEIIRSNNDNIHISDSNPNNKIIKNHHILGNENTEGYSEDTTDINLKINDNIISNIVQYKKAVTIKKSETEKIIDSCLKSNYSFDSNKNANLEEITKFSNKNNYKDIYYLTREGNKIKNQNLKFIQKNKNYILSQINTDAYIEILQKQNRIILAYKLYCLYVLLHDNYQIIVKRKYFKKWQKHNKIFNNIDTINDGHIHKKNGHCENCDCDDRAHCPGCFCLEKNMCFRCDCKNIKKVLKNILIKNKFLKEMNPIKYYFYLWNKNSKK